MADQDQEEKKSWAETVTISPQWALQYMILEKREGVIMNLQKIRKMEVRNQVTDMADLYGWFEALYWELGAALKRDLPKDDLEIIEKSLKSEDLRDLKIAFSILNSWLDKKKLIRFDTKGGYDRTRVEEENKHYGL